MPPIMTLVLLFSILLPKLLLSSIQPSGSPTFETETSSSRSSRSRISENPQMLAVACLCHYAFWNNACYLSRRSFSFSSLILKICVIIRQT